MKKGFLLSETKVPRSRDAPSTSADADGCRSAANIPRQRQSSGIRRRQRPKQHQPTTIKRGFLLGSSKFSSGPRSSSSRHLATDEDAPRPFNNCDKSLPPLPQCRPREGGGSLSTSRSKRVVTRSNALLDTSFNEIDSSAEDDEYNQQFHPAASSSLLQIVRDESDADEGETPFHCENNDALLHHEGQKDDNPSLDSWIEPSLESSTLPSIILPSSTQHSRSSQRIPCNSKQRKPLIVEMDDNPTVREATSRNLTPLAISSNDAVGPCQNDRAVIDNRIEEIGTRTEQQHQCPADADSGDSIRKVVPTPKDSFQFTNAVSIILSKLDRSIRSNSHHKNSHPDNCRDPSVIGVGTIVNTHTETMIQSFVTKHLSSTFELLNNIWSVILDEVAQDCTEFIQSKKKKRSRSHNISPSLTLGLGILELLSPREAAYESLVRQLLLIETSQGGSSQDTQGRLEGREKQQKVLALGAVYLLRCRIRCINISLTNMELGMADSSKIQESIGHLRNEIELEIGILLSKILPSLENIVNGNASNGQTVLTSAAADTCFELIEISSRSTMNHQRFRGTSPSEMTDSMKKWKSVLPLIERLMAAKQRWVNSSASSDQSDDNLEMDGCSSRTTCTNAVLIDWFDIIKSSKRLYFDYLVGNGLLEGCDHSAASNFFVNLSGILLRKSAVGESSEVAYFRGGGIAQSLCQHKECIFGSIISPIYGSDSDVVTLLHYSCKLTDNIRDTRRNNSASPDAFTKINHQRSAVRSFASWISSGNKAIRILTKSNQNPDADVDLLDSSMVSLVLMLRSESKQCVDLSIASLSMVLSAFPDWTPQSFDVLLEALHVHSTQSFDDNGTQSTQSANDELQLSPTCRALCTVVAKAASRKPTTLLPSILKMNGRVELMIEVALNMLEMLPSSPSAEEAHYSVYHAASVILLENIESVPYLRSRLLSNTSLYTNVPHNVIIPKIVENLVDRYAKRETDAGVSALAGVLCNMMKASVESGRADDFMRCVVSSLQNVDEKETISPTTFLNKNGSLWRLAICNDASTSEYAYKDILLAAARSMIEMPSNSVPLAAFASLVGNQYGGVSSTDDVAARFEKRIFIAASGIIHFSMNELSTPCKEAEESIFSQLAPLLILRRLPRSYYRVVHKSLSSDNETRDVVGRLASILSDNLKSLAMKDNPSSLDMEQKKLLAELLGHCLPLTNKVINGLCYSAGADELHVSLYDNICKEAFSMILKSLREDRDMSQLEVDKIHISDVSQAKAALYAVCHHIPLAVDEDDGEMLIHVASFIFEILNYQPTATSGTTQFINEITMLQSGCTHFLAVCVDSLSYRKANGAEAATSTPLIVDIDIQEDSNDSRATNTIIGALSHIFHALVAIIITGECNTGDNHTTTQFLPSTRTAVLNSVVMLVQSSRADDTRTQWLAFNILPPLVEWTSKGPIDEDIHHPLCLAAALQVIYTVLARCGSFDWISRNANSGSITLSETDFICRTLQCALTLFHTSGENETSIAALRLAALKVILTVLALHQSKEFERVEDLKGYLSPAEIQKALSAMHGAANVDQNPEVRRLANQILIHMQTS